MAHTLFEFGRDSNIGLLDLGTPNVNGSPNQGLIRNKKNLGCTESQPLTLARHFS